MTERELLSDHARRHYKAMTVEIFDPPMSCPTGLCGPTIDSSLLDVNEMALELQSQGMTVERYSMAQQPHAFLNNTEVYRLVMRFLSQPSVAVWRQQASDHNRRTRKSTGTPKSVCFKRASSKEMNMAREEEVRDALRPVMGPEIGMSVVDLGMIRQIVLGKGGEVEIKMVLTTPFCPLVSMITEQAQQAAAGVPGVKEAKVTLLDQPWDPTWMKH